jgi:hypothetical protein
VTTVSTNLTPKITFVEGAAPGTPPSGQVYEYAKADGLLYQKDDTGTETALGGAAGAPTNADYLVGTANGSLSAEIVVGTSPGGELGGTWASPTVDTTHSGSSHVPAVLLTYDLASDHSGAALTAGAAFDIIANQNFTVAHTGSLVQVSVRGNAFCNSAVSNQYLIRINIDSGGTPVIRYMGGASNINTTANDRHNVFSGVSPVSITGLSAAVHTIKVQIIATGNNDTFFCRAATNGPTTGAEFMQVQVVEFG